MTRTVEPMTSGPIWKRLTLFALPLFLGNLFQQLYNTVDALIVGNFLGSTALAAVSSSGSLTFMLVGFLSGVFGGAGVVAARLYGAKDEETLRRAVHTTVSFAFAAGLALTALGVALTPRLLVWMDTPASVLPQAVTYLQIYFSGSLAVVLYNACVGVLQAVGDSRHPLYYLMVSSVVNLVLDVAFIEAFHTGVGGAAVATVISQAASAALCLAHLLRSRECYRLRLRELGFDPALLKEIVRIGLPSGVQNSIIAFANVLVQSNVNAFGEMAMAGYGAYTKVEGFGFLPINSFTMALTTFVGQNLGAQEFERTRKGARFGVVTALALAEAIGLVIFLFAPACIAAFDPTPQVVAFGVDKARTAALFYFLLAYSHSIAAVLRGAGRATVPMFIMMICWCAVRVGFLAVTVPLTHSIQMVYWVYPLTWALSSLAFFLYYTHGNWLNCQIAQRRLPKKD